MTIDPRLSDEALTYLECVVRLANLIVRKSCCSRKGGLAKDLDRRRKGRERKKKREGALALSKVSLGKGSRGGASTSTEQQGNARVLA